jgi:hypothetical protein
VVEDRRLDPVDLLVQAVHDRHVVGHHGVRQGVQHVVRSLRQAALRGLAALVPQVLHRGNAVFVDRNQVVRTEEEVEFVGFQRVVGVQPGGVQHDVQVVLPVIDPGDVGLPEGVVQGQGVEPEQVAEQAGDPGGVLAGKGHVQPEGAALVLQGFAHLVGGEVLGELAVVRTEEGTDHGGHLNQEATGP